MAKQRRDEAITASFHFLIRGASDGNDRSKENTFSQEEFDDLCKSIIDQPQPDLTNKKEFNLVKFGQTVPFSKILQIDGKCLFGVYEGAYWGHAYKNSAKGEIPADSINQRKFHFMLYLSDSGRIYIASQYLGNYGFYTGLKQTIVNMLADSKNIQSRTFRQDQVDFSKAEIKEIKVSTSQKASAISSKNIFSNSSMLVVKRPPEGKLFEDTVRESIFPLLKSPIHKRKKAISELLQNSLMDVDDREIDHCTVITSIKGRERVVYVLGAYNFATRFHLDVEIKYDGHPKYNQTKDAIYELLTNQIISRKEDV